MHHFSDREELGILTETLQALNEAKGGKRTNARLAGCECKWELGQHTVRMLRSAFQSSASRFVQSIEMAEHKAQATSE